MREFNSDTIVTVPELKQLMTRRNCRSVDCRFLLTDTGWGRAQYANGHIPGAVYAHLDEDLSGQIVPGVTGRHPLPMLDSWVSQVREWGIRNGDQIVAYDQGFGGFAARAWWLFRWIGHENVAVLDGGIEAWVSGGNPLVSDKSDYARSAYVPNVRDELRVDAAVVDEWRNREDRAVIDSRDADRYAGEIEPIDPVAGHIPGALNIPFKQHITSEGTWRAPDELQGAFSSLRGRKPEECVFYCGSGVTACHNILAFKRAGFGDARLYPGSWSEWITDSSREVTVGRQTR